MSSSPIRADNRVYSLKNLNPGHVSSPGTYSALPGQSTAHSQAHDRDGDPFLDYNGNSNAANTLHGSDVRPPRHVYSSWVWEIISIILSILCMAAIVVVLVIYDSQPAPTLPSGITLNALISVLATISKASMLVSVASCISQLKWQCFSRPRKLIYFNILDEASRGPWGSFSLLWKTRRPSVAGLGALITILAVGLDPFIQQIIAYPTKNVEAGNNSITRAQTYDTGFLSNQVHGGILAGPELGMKATIYNGIFNQSSSLESTFECSTGNCTFPIMDSLAFCSKCQNVTDKTTLSAYNIARKNFTDFYPGDTVANYTFILPGNYTINITAFLQSDDSAPLMYGPVMVSNFGMPESMSRSQLGIPNPISSLAVLQWPQVERLAYHGDYVKEKPQAWQCALYFCLQTYDTTVSKGIPNVDVVSTTDIETPLPVISNFPADYVSTNSVTFQRPSDSVVKGGNANFYIPDGTIAAMAAYLNYTMSGNQIAHHSETNDQNRWPNDVMQALNSTVNITSMMSNIASSVTTFMRLSDSRGSFPDTVATGTAFKEETYVHVRWAWIALPVFVLLAALIFLIVTIFRASRARIPVWKSSSLATLFNGLAEDDEDTAHNSFRGGGPVSSIKDMQEAAETMETRLRKGINGEWSLAVAKPSNLD